MNKIAVYCGSNLGNSPTYFAAAQAMGQALAARQIALVYGGGKIGLMGAVADSVLNAGGEAIGVIPTFLRDKEMAHKGLTELIETPDMATRKAKMIELAEGFIAMPGGLGTFEELFEVLSHAQLRLHQKPVGVLNINGFFNPLIASMQKAADEGFMPQANMSLLCVGNTPEDLLAQMASYQFVDTQKWIEPTWQKTAKSAAV